MCACGSLSNQALATPPCAVERERDLSRLDPQRASREPPPAQLRREPLGEAQTVLDLGLCALVAVEDPLRLAVGQPGTAADRGAVEERLPGSARVERHLDRDGEAVLSADGD